MYTYMYSIQAVVMLENFRLITSSIQFKVSKNVSYFLIEILTEIYIVFSNCFFRPLFTIFCFISVMLFHKLSQCQSILFCFHFGDKTFVLSFHCQQQGKVNTCHKIFNKMTFYIFHLIFQNDENFQKYVEMIGFILVLAPKIYGIYIWICRKHILYITSAFIAT